MAKDIGTVEERPDDDVTPEAEEFDGEPVVEPEPLPEHKADLVALAIARRVPSYEAWAMTVPELKETLRG